MIAKAKLNAGEPIIFMQGEETAGVVGDILRKNILDELAVAYESMDVGVAQRILTQNKVMTAVCDRVKESSKSTLVKEPTVTPSPEQMLAAVEKLENEGKLKFPDDGLNRKIAELRKSLAPEASEENMAKFAYAIVGSKSPVTYKGIKFEKGAGLVDGSGSPNAVWRKELGATLLRSVSALLEENSKAEMPEWSVNTPVSVIARQIDDDNTTLSRVNAGNYKVIFESAGSGEVKNIGTMNIEGDDTPVRLYSDSEKSFKAWLNQELDGLKGDEKLVHALKQTVITTDYAYIEWMNDVLSKRGLTGNIPKLARDAKDPAKLNTKLLTDNVIGALASNPPVEETVMIAPNASYSDYVGMMQGIREAGGFKNQVNSEIIRAAATKDHYARQEFRAEEAGTIKMVDGAGKVVFSKAMQKNDIAMMTNFDRSRVANLVEQTLDHAVASGRTNILFGFDEKDPYYKVAVEELNKKRADKKYSGLNLKVGDPKGLTVEYFSKGVKNTLLALGNIHGDFATDIELSGKGTAYSKALLSDGRMAIETGSLGTAPDILHDPDKNFGWKKDGVLVYNPMAFIEAYSYALEGVAQNMGNDKLMEKTAKALEASIYKTTRKGIILPISSGTLVHDKGVEETKVSTHTFVKNVLLETMRSLKGVHPNATPEKIAALETEVSNNIRLDTAIYDILAGKVGNVDAWKEANWKINEALTKAGVIDTDHPDYSIKLPKGVDYSKINAQTLLEIRLAQAAEFNGGVKSGSAGGVS